eukprot:143241-Chlamydomonas_euryale.AAC.1
MLPGTTPRPAPLPADAAAAARSAGPATPQRPLSTCSGRSPTRCTVTSSSCQLSTSADRRADRCAMPASLPPSSGESSSSPPMPPPPPLPPPPEPTSSAMHSGCPWALNPPPK